MTDKWTDRLSEYLDGGLAAAEQAELEQHLEQCFECRRVLGDLRAVVARAAALEDSAPGHDLWSGIASRLSEKPLQLSQRTAVGVDKTIPPPSPLHRPSRRIAFSLPQLAAAAIALMVLSGSLVWVMVGPPAASAPQASAPASTVRAVSDGPAALQEYASAVGQLETVLRQNRDRLDPVTVAILEENLKSIDAAITEARGALERDPGNLYLNQHLENTMKKKIQLLRRASALGGAAI